MANDCVNPVEIAGEAAGDTEWAEICADPVIGAAIALMPEMDRAVLYHAFKTGFSSGALWYHRYLKKRGVRFGE